MFFDLFQSWPSHSHTPLKSPHMPGRPCQDHLVLRMVTGARIMRSQSQDFPWDINTHWIKLHQSDKEMLAMEGCCFKLIHVTKGLWSVRSHVPASVVLRSHNCWYQCWWLAYSKSLIQKIRCENNLYIPFLAADTTLLFCYFCSLLSTAQSHSPCRNHCNSCCNSHCIMYYDSRNEKHR